MYGLLSACVTAPTTPVPPPPIQLHPQFPFLFNHARPLLQEGEPCFVGPTNMITQVVHHSYMHTVLPTHPLACEQACSVLAVLMPLGSAAGLCVRPV